MISTPMANSCHSTSSPASDTAERNTPTISAPDQRADDRAAAAEQAGAADHHRGDAVEVGVLAGGRADRADAADQRPAGDRGDEPGEHIDAEQDPVGIDAGQPRSFGIVAGGVDMAAIGRAVEHVPKNDRQRDQQETCPR